MIPKDFKFVINSDVWKGLKSTMNFGIILCLSIHMSVLITILISGPGMTFMSTRRSLSTLFSPTRFVVSFSTASLTICATSNIFSVPSKQSLIVVPVLPSFKVGCTTKLTQILGLAYIFPFITKRFNCGLSAINLTNAAITMSI